MTWEIELVLPYPISVNRYWVNRTAKAASGRPFMARMGSKEGQAYKQHVAWIARQAKVALIAGPVEYELDLYPPRPQDWERRAKINPAWWDIGVRVMDLDNARKVMVDALNGIIWTDDLMIRRDKGEIMVPDGRARCVLRVRPYTRPLPAGQLEPKWALYMAPPAPIKPRKSKATTGRRRSLPPPIDSGRDPF